MIDVVSPVTGGGLQFKQANVSRPPVQAPSPPPEVQSSSQGAMRIRVDNHLNMAIIEYRSSEGEIMHQYPTEAQVKAIARAAELEDTRTTVPVEAEAETADVAPQVSADTSDADVPAVPSFAPAPAATAAAAPAIVSAPAAAAVSVVPSAASTQSITV